MADNVEPDNTITNLVGNDDGVIVTGAGNKREEVVYDYDADGQFVGWHKETVN